MLITKISISNFLCYYGSDNQFEFVEGLNIVLGANGYGKSKLYDAFQWVFSDGITDDPQRTTTPSGLHSTSVVKGELVSEKAKAECAISESVETKVMVEVSQPRNGYPDSPRKYQLVRTYQVRRIDDTVWVEPGKSNFQILEFDILSFRPIPENKHNEVLERLIPVDVRPYVWFQGERGISNLIDTSSNGSLRNVIKRLSDIDRWDKYIQVTAKAHDTAKKDWEIKMSKSKKNQQAIEQSQTKYRLLENEISKLEEQITNALRNQQGAQAKKDELLASIEFAEKIAELTEARNRAEAAYTTAVKQSDGFDESLSRNLFSDNWVLLGTSSLVDKFEEKLNAYDEAIYMRKAVANLNKQTAEKLQIRLPDNVPEPMYVRQMLDEEHCRVCDRPAPKGSDAYTAIASLLLSEPEIVQPERPHINLKPFFRQLLHKGLEMKSSIEGIDYRVKQSYQKRTDARDKVMQSQAELDKTIKGLQDQEQRSGITNAHYIVNSMDAAIADITKYGEALVEHRAEKERKEQQQRTINDELKGFSEGQIPAHLIRKKTILNDLAELAKRVKDTKYRELVRDLEDATNEHYRNINAPTGAFYGRIQFVETADGGYQPTILDNDGRRVSRPNTSLASSMKLSIIMGIVSANKTRDYTSFYPLIADAPVSDFDPAKIPAFLQETANTFRQSIVIVKELLVKDTARINRFKPDLAQLHELRDKLKVIGKPLTVYQLDMADGVSNAFRSEIEITIQKVD